MEENVEKTLQNPQVNPQPTVMQTYSNVIQQARTPKKDQAIIIDSVEGLTNDDYIDGLELLIDVMDITHISKISGARVCVFLRNSSLVDELNNKKVQVKDYCLNIRPYMERNKRVVISNAKAYIPDYLLVDALKREGIVPISQVSEIKAGLYKPGRSHIHCHRRQVYIKAEDEKKLPDHVLVNFENSTHTIFFSTDLTQCYICKQTGHIAKVCPWNTEDTARVPTHSNEYIVDTSKEFASTSTTLPIIVKKRSPNVNTNLNIMKSVKRPPPSSTTSEDLSNSQAQEINIQKDGSQQNKDHNIITYVLPTSQKEDESTYSRTGKDEPATTKKESKKAKRRRLSQKKEKKEEKEDTSAEIINALLPAAEIFTKPEEKLPINFEQLTDFIKYSYSRDNHYETTKSITDNAGAYTEVIEKVYPFIKEKNVKSNLTRLKNKLIQKMYKQELSDITDTESGNDYCSQTNMESDQKPRYHSS